MMVISTYDAHFVGKYHIVADNTVCLDLRITAYIKIPANDECFPGPDTDPRASVKSFGNLKAPQHDMHDEKIPQMFYKACHT
jgi:hypothetical protein